MHGETGEGEKRRRVKGSIFCNIPSASLTQQLVLLAAGISSTYLLQATT